MPIKITTLTVNELGQAAAVRSDAEAAAASAAAAAASAAAAAASAVDAETGDFASVTTTGSVRFGGTPNGLANNPRATISASAITVVYDYSAQTELVVSRDGDCRITIAADGASSSVLSFADQASETPGQIEYDHAIDTMIFRAGASDVAKLSAGELQVNDRVNIEGVTPEILMRATASAADEGIWRIATDPDQIFFQTRTDANGAGQNYHVVTRSGTAVTQQDFSANGLLQFRLSSGGMALASGATVNTIETTLTDDDTHIPTSGAVVDYVASEIAAIPATPDATVLLGTINTTSGSSQSLTGQDLTGYKFVRFVFDGVSTLGATTISVGGQSAVGDASDNAATWRGIVEIDLATGVGTAVLGSISGGGSTAATETRILETSLSTASTTLAVTTNGSFDAGSVKVYGIA